ncbi:MAG: peptidyl-prolyl cis-trans isomerase [Chitinophagaceae bacterium]|nr:MAG: peptidyl-prolyl cis-trans isomerase [Chitinophagaceae bacterium]
MSVIQTIRDRGTWIVFVIIALALIAFILQDGANRGGTAFSNTSVITKVNGTAIQRGEFEEKLKMQEQMYQGQGATREQLIGNVWNQEVERTVLNQEFEKLGLVVSVKEMNEILFSENSPLRQEFTDPQTGVFKVDDAKRAFAQIKKSKNAEQIKMINAAYIEPTIENGKRTKYQNLLVQSVYVPKWMVEKQIADNNAIASISYVYYPYVSIADSLAKVSDEDINAYVKKHGNEFQKEEETRTISYVSFNAGPSGVDSLNTLNQVLGLEKDFAAAPDAQAYLAKVGTELPYYDSYFSRSKMQMSLKDSIVRLPVGGLYGPYLDGNNYVIAKMVATKQWPDSAKVRHILVATADPRSGQQIRTDSSGKKLIDSLENAIKGGADFAALAAQYSDDPGSKTKGGVYEFFPQGQMMIPFNDFSFDKPVGSKGIVKTEFGYHYMEVLAQKNVNPVYKIAYLAKPIVSSNETVGAAETAAAQFATSSKSAKAFTENANKQNLTILTATEIKASDFNINTIGQTRGLVRTIYEKKEGDIIEPTEVGDRYIVAYVSAINKPGLMNATEARPLVEGIVRNEKKAKQIIDTKIKGTTLDEISKSTGSPILRADSLGFAAAFVSGIGSEPKVVGAAFNKSLQGKVSSPIAGAAGVFSVKGEFVGANINTNTPDVVKQGLIQTRKMGVYRSVEALRKAAEIKDFRSTFY